MTSYPGNFSGATSSNAPNVIPVGPSLGAYTSLNPAGLTGNFFVQQFGGNSLVANTNFEQAFAIPVVGPVGRQYIRSCNTISPPTWTPWQQVGAGQTGDAGPTGGSGPTGPSGPSGAAVLPSAQYARLGAQPATVAAGEPFTYDTAVLTNPGIIATTAIFNPPFTVSGTVFELVNVGRYEVNWQMVYPTDGGVVLSLGATVVAMLPLPYSMIGKSPNGAVSGSVIIETTTPSEFLAVIAAAGNAAAIDIPPNSSTTNANSTTVSIKQIS